MKNKLSILLYSILFSGLGIFSYLLLITYANLPVNISGKQISPIGILLFFIVTFNVLGHSIIRLSSWINGRYPLYVKQRWKVTAIYLMVTAVLLMLNYGLLVCAKLILGATHPFTFPNGGIRVLIIVWLVELVVLGLLVVNNFIRDMLRLQQHTAELQAENNTARYTALQNQLNPHFLFNSLNTLIAEIEYDPKNAVVFTKNLSNVYRYVLQCQDKPLVSLGEELDFAKAYLFLHRVRLGDCIDWKAHIPTDYIESMLPPLTLQLLVENVIKHNTITMQKPMEITISIENNQLIVSNSVHLKRNAESSGIGLKNLSKRCNLMLGKTITVIDNESVFTVKVPLLYE
ncbi:MAG: histidine kinase [Bacteroidales bacterium]